MFAFLEFTREPVVLLFAIYGLFALLLYHAFRKRQLLILLLKLLIQKLEEVEIFAISRQVLLGPSVVFPLSVILQLLKPGLNLEARNLLLLEIFVVSEHQDLFVLD